MNAGIHLSDGAYFQCDHHHGERVYLGWEQVVIRLSASGVVMQQALYLKRFKSMHFRAYAFGDIRTHDDRRPKVDDASSGKRQLSVR
jgi:hypothetical protein